LYIVPVISQVGVLLPLVITQPSQSKKIDDRKSIDINEWKLNAVNWTDINWYEPADDQQVVRTKMSLNTLIANDVINW